MALTLKMEQRLTALSLTQLYAQHVASWQQMVEGAYAFVKENFPPDSIIRRDDVATALRPLLEVDPKLTAYLKSKNKTQNYWIDYFGAYIIENQWEHLTEAQQ